MPAFAHMPVILAPDKSKLSKRHGAASVMDYRDMGVIPSSLMNYLALLGWSLDDKTEVFSPDELIESFELSRVSRSDAVFDLDKLLWINGQHIRRTSDVDLADHLGSYWSSSPPDFDMTPTSEQIAQVTPLVRERLKTLQDAAPLVEFVFLKQDFGESRRHRAEGNGPAFHRSSLESRAQGTRGPGNVRRSLH